MVPSLLIFVIFSQSCVVYQNTPVSLNDATDQGKVKLITNAGLEMKMKKIYTVDDQHFGIYNSQKIQLQEYQIQSLYLKNKSKSNTRTFLLILGISPFAIIAGTFLFWALIGPPI